MTVSASESTITWLSASESTITWLFQLLSSLSHDCVYFWVNYHMTVSMSESTITWLNFWAHHHMTLSTSESTITWLPASESTITWLCQLLNPHHMTVCQLVTESGLCLYCIPHHHMTLCWLLCKGTLYHSRSTQTVWRPLNISQVPKPVSCVVAWCTTWSWCWLAIEYKLIASW